VNLTYNQPKSRPIRLAYQPPANSTFISEQTSHQQPASDTFLSEQINISRQPNEQAIDMEKMDRVHFIITF
jgi:hypothetical protein